MSQQQSPKILRLLHDYRKQLSLLKIKSFYANHLCKQNCLLGKLQSNPNECFESCDKWLDDFYQIKKEKYPMESQNYVFSAEDVKGVSDEERVKYVKGYAEAKINIKNYLELLNNHLDEKIKIETKK